MVLRFHIIHLKLCKNENVKYDIVKNSIQIKIIYNLFDKQSVYYKLWL